MVAAGDLRFDEKLELELSTRRSVRLQPTVSDSSEGGRPASVDGPQAVFVAVTSSS